MIEPAEVNGNAQDPAHLVIKLSLRDRSGIEQRNESLPVVVNAEGHLEIEATLHGRSSVVG